MKMLTIANATFLALSLIVGKASATDWATGIPTLIQKSDYSTLHLIYIQFDKPIPSTTTGCTGNTGVVVLDSDPSSKAALSMALVAQVSNKNFRCFITDNQCSAITGAATTYPICTTYPTIFN